VIVVILLLPTGFAGLLARLRVRLTRQSMASINSDPGTS